METAINLKGDFPSEYLQQKCYNLTKTDSVIIKLGGKTLCRGKIKIKEFCSYGFN